MAEVLITLGIIGVVAAMTMPTLMANHRKMVLKNQFKAMYSIIYQAVLATKQELGSNSLYDEYTYYSTENGNYPYAREFKDAFYKHLKIIGNVNAEVSDYSIYSDKSIKLQADGTSFSLKVPDNALSNGATMSVSVNSSIDGKRIAFITDINGNKGPNRFGHDLFVFQISDSSDKLIGVKKIRDYTDDELGDLEGGGINNLLGLPCSKNSKQTSNGIGCTYYAIADECPDDSSKGYWDCLPK